MLNLTRLQNEVEEWTEKNFTDETAVRTLLGVVEEVGELSHAQLKEIQGIRVNEDHEEEAKDAVGDIIIFLAHYCNCRGWDMENITRYTWKKVQQRDGNENPEQGITQGKGEDHE